MIRALLLLLLLAPSLAQALELLYLQAAPGTAQTRVWSGRFTAPNGERFDASDYYAPQGPTFHLRAAPVFDLGESVSLFLPLEYDHGYRSDLLTATPRLSLGLGLRWKDDRTEVALQFGGLAQLGGRIEERPCVDDFQREFHCGLGIPWSDAAPHLSTGRVQPRLSLVIRHRF